MILVLLLLFIILGLYRTGNNRIAKWYLIRREEENLHGAERKPKRIGMRLMRK